MTRQSKWKKAEAETAIKAIALAVAEAFNVEAPACYAPEHIPSHSWEWQFDTIKIWTKAGAAEMNVTIDAHAAHMYFRFDQPTRAESIAHGCNRLNRHSGKWNSLVCPPVALADWLESLKADFAAVAEPNPNPIEYATWQAKEARAAAYWAEMREEFAAQCAARKVTEL